MQAVLPLGCTCSTSPNKPTLDAILSQGFAEVSIDPSTIAECVPILRDDMRRLTDHRELGELFPMQVPFIDDMGWKMEAGLIRRKGVDESGNGEDKFFFHFIPGIRWERKSELGPFVDFLSACERINTTAKNIALFIASEFDVLHGLSYTDRSLVSAVAEEPTVTRILRYKNSGKNKADAYTHLDRSALTVHWWASDPGLILIDTKGRQRRVDETAFDRVAVFPSKKFGGFFSGKHGYGTLHGVRNERENGGEDRYSLVSFVHAKLSPEAVQWIRDKTIEMDALEKLHAL